MKTYDIGTKVKLPKKQIGVIVAYGRSTNHPWKVYFVAAAGGKTIELHADRIEVA